MPLGYFPSTPPYLGQGDDGGLSTTPMGGCPACAGPLGGCGCPPAGRTKPCVGTALEKLCPEIPLQYRVEFPPDWKPIGICFLFSGPLSVITYYGVNGRVPDGQVACTWGSDVALPDSDSTPGGPIGNPVYTHTGIILSLDPSGTEFTLAFYHTNFRMQYEEIRYTLPAAAWNCLGPNTLAFSGTSFFGAPGNCNWPPTFTVTPL